MRYYYTVLPVGFGPLKSDQCLTRIRQFSSSFLSKDEGGQFRVLIKSSDRLLFDPFSPPSTFLSAKA